MTRRGLIRLSLAAALATLTTTAALAQPFGYVVAPRPSGGANRGPQFLAVIDIATRTRVTSIQLGEGCLCVGELAAVSADGARVFVSNFWSNTVSVVDTATNTLVQTLPTHSFPGALAVSPDGTRLYVNAYLSSGPAYVVQVLDTASGATIATVPLSVPQSGSGMAISPDGTRLYVTNQALTGSNVKIIDTAALTVIGTVTTGPVPRAIDLSPDGSVAYVAVQEAGVVSAIDTASQTLTGSIAAGLRPLDVRVLRDGSRVYAVAQDQLTTIVTATGVTLPPVPTLGARTIDFTPDGRTGVVAADGAVRFFDTAGHAFTGSIAFNTAVDGNPMYVVIPRAATAAPDAPTGVSIGSVVGNQVTLQWQPPVAGVPPSGYEVEGGVLPGEVLATIRTGHTRPAFTFTAPSGAFYVRLHAVGAGGRSPASNEVRLFVNTPTAPSAPADFLALVNNASVTLNWRNTFGGGAPASLALDVSGAQTLSIPLGLTERFEFAGVPAGTYTLQLRAINAAGVSSPASTPLTLTFPSACSGIPQTPTDFVAFREGRTIFLRWQSPPAGAAAGDYVVNVSGAFAGNVRTPARHVEGTVGPGTYVLTVAAANACGISPPSPSRTIVIP